MSKIALIGGTGLSKLDELEITRHEKVDTPYGAPSSELQIGRYRKRDVIFLPRHGAPHSILPHKINYRANIWALKTLGVEVILAVNAVGAINEKLAASGICLPDQIIDYSYGRENSFFGDEFDEGVDFLSRAHIDFSYPYDDELRNTLLLAAKQQKVDVLGRGVFACTQGPRLESAAEIGRLERDGCDIVGMTSMPEAALAREVGIRYACLALVVNMAAGKTQELITMDDIILATENGVEKVLKILSAAIESI